MYIYLKMKSEVNKGMVGILFYIFDGSCWEFKFLLDLSYVYLDGVLIDIVIFGDLVKNMIYKDLRNMFDVFIFLWNDLLYYMVDYMNGDIDVV